MTPRMQSVGLYSLAIQQRRAEQWRLDRGVVRASRQAHILLSAYGTVNIQELQSMTLRRLEVTYVCHYQEGTARY